MVHEVYMGKKKRMSFSRINEVLDMPDLIEVQKNSYQRFVEEDLKEVLDDISPITDYSEKLVLEFVDYSIDFDHPKYSVEECKERDVNYKTFLWRSIFTYMPEWAAISLIRNSPSPHASTALLRRRTS